MTITLYLEHRGRIREKEVCRLDVMEKIAAAWYRMYAGKRVIVFYTLQSKIDMEYYVVSTRHTSKGDTALTLWGKNHSGYTYHKDRAGLYGDEDRAGIEASGDVFVKKEDADKLFLPAKDFNDEFIALPNDITVRTILGIPTKNMKPVKYKSCKMIFHLPTEPATATGDNGNS